MKKVLLVLFVLVLNAGVFAQSNVYRDKSKCYITAQDFIKQKLKYPKEAKFDRNVVHETDGYGSAILLGKVTAKNAFGIQSEYVYKIWLDHNGKDWTELRNWTMKKLIMEDVSTGEQKVYNR